MIDNERRMTHLERYTSMRKMLERPTFDSEEDARQNVRVVDGEFRRFVIRAPLSAYRVCYAFIAHPRDGEPRWEFNEEYTFTHSQMYTAKNQAALAVGLELVGSME